MALLFFPTDVVRQKGLRKVLLGNRSVSVSRFVFLVSVSGMVCCSKPKGRPPASCVRRPRSRSWPEASDSRLCVCAPPPPVAERAQRSGADAGRILGDDRALPVQHQLPQRPTFPLHHRRPAEHPGDRDARHRKCAQPPTSPQNTAQADGRSLKPTVPLAAIANSGASVPCRTKRSGPSDSIRVRLDTVCARSLPPLLDCVEVSVEKSRLPEVSFFQEFRSGHDERGRESGQRMDFSGRPDSRPGRPHPTPKFYERFAFAR